MVALAAVAFHRTDTGTTFVESRNEDATLWDTHALELEVMRLAVQ